MDMCFEGFSFQEVKKKAIEIYQSHDNILDFEIAHKRNTDKWIVRFRIPNPTFFTNLMLDK